MLIILL